MMIHVFLLKEEARFRDEKMFLLIIAKQFTVTMTMCGFDKNGDQTEGMSEMRAHVDDSVRQ